MKRASWILGRLVLTTTTQAQGAPLIDRGTTRSVEPNRLFNSLVIRVPFTRHRPTKAIVVGWEERPRTDLTWRQWLRVHWRLGIWQHCPACNDDAPAIDRCMVCCGRADWAKYDGRDWRPSLEECTKLTHRYFLYCVRPARELEWDRQLSYAHDCPPASYDCCVLAVEESEDHGG